MPSQPLSRVGDDYVLPTGADEESRLDLIHAVYGPVSLKGLEAAEIGGCSRVADIGCGTGTVSRWMAQRIGPDGIVDGIDISQEQIDVASSTPAPPDTGPIQYHVGTAYDPPLPKGAFDLVFCRLVLCHLQEPAKAVAQMAKLLNDGGRLVLVDVDLRTPFTMPACTFYESIINEAVLPVGAKLGVDYAIGVRLHELMSDAALKTDFITADQPIFRDGPEKHLWERTWSTALPRAAETGVVATEQAEALIAGAERHTASPEVWVATAKMFAAVGRKPA